MISYRNDSDVLSLKMYVSEEDLGTGGGAEPLLLLPVAHFFK